MKYLYYEFICQVLAEGIGRKLESADIDFGQMLGLASFDMLEKIRKILCYRTSNDTETVKRILDVYAQYEMETKL